MKRTTNQTELANAATQMTFVEIPVTPYNLRQLGLERLEVLPMPTINERDLLFRAAIHLDGWGRHRYGAPYDLTVCYLTGPVKTDSNAVWLDVAIGVEEDARPSDATGPGIVRHDCQAVLARVPTSDGASTLEVLLKRPDGAYSRAKDAARAILIDADVGVKLPLRRL